MKLRFYLLPIILNLLAFTLSGQECDNPTSANGDYLHANNIRAFYMASGSSHFDGTDAQYLVDDPLLSSDQSIATIFAHGLWMGGYDPGANLSVAISEYGVSSGNYDYYAGPLMDDGSVANTDCTNFDRVWDVYRYQIEAHQADFADNGAIDAPIPDVIGWPAQGNAQFENINGFELPNNSQGYAAFADLNANGIYEPLQGEYPAISQTTQVDQPVEQISWMIFNTRGNAANESGSMSQLAIEIQLTAWALNCTDNKVLNNSTFASYRLINKGLESIQDFRAALWTDFDLGCYTDDYVGSAPMLNTFFAYNQDNDDDEACPGGVLGAGENPPVQSITFLNQVLDNFSYYSNVGSIPSPGGPPSPYSVLSYYNMMDGLFADGTPITEGGTGYNPESTNEPVSHAFPDDPNDDNGWSEFSEQIAGGDRRTLGSTGVSELLPGAVFTLDVAYVYHREEDADHLANVSNMYVNVAEVQANYNSGFTNICTAPTTCEDDCVWAGDLNADGIANHEDLIALGFGLNESGPTRNGPYNWYPRDGESWLGNQVFGADKKHLDADGNGSCSENDFFVKTIDHYNFTRPDYEPVIETTPGDDLIIQKYPGEEELINLAPGASFLARIALLADIPNLRALSFIMEFDQNYIERFIPFSYGGTDHLAYLHDYVLFENEGRIDFAEYALPQSSDIGENVIVGTLRIQSSFPEPLPSDETFICFRNIRGFLSDGTEVEIGANKVRVQIDGIAVNTQEPDWGQSISLFPNPVNKQLQLQAGDTEIGRIEIADGHGRILSSFDGNTRFLDVRQFPAGIYYLRLFSEGNFVIRKFVKM